MWLSCFFPQDKKLHYEAPWSTFILLRSPLLGVSTLWATSDTLFKHWSSVLTYCCVPRFLSLFYLLCFIMQLLGNCHRTAWSQRKKEMINFWRTIPLRPSTPSPNALPRTAPWPLLLTSSSHNYLAKELQKENTQSNFSCPVMKSSLK